MVLTCSEMEISKNQTIYLGIPFPHIISTIAYKANQLHSGLLNHTAGLAFAAK